MAMPDLSPLDNPIYHALATVQAPLALSRKKASRYRPSISPLAGLESYTFEAFGDLHTLVRPGETVALFTRAPVPVPADWETVKTRYIDQMVCPRLARTPEVIPVPLYEDDVPEMLALTALTEPGPFLPETIRMGRYFGLRSPEGRLMAMAGQRLGLEGFTEISAVCTHPDFRGQGHAATLVTFLAALIFADGKLPFLHVKTENGAAKKVYQKAGFELCEPIHLTVLTPAR
jgi:GNAT superfamily N-acetyltransferase